jgi:serine/threonine protein kinase
MTHPTRDQLQLLGKGKLADKDEAELAAHVDTCADCAAKAETATKTPFELKVHEAATLSEATPDTLPPLGMLGPYRLVSMMKEGGMGVVYKARHPNMDKFFVVKTIRPDKKDVSGMRERFLRETKLQSQFENDHVMPIYNAGEDNGELYLAMPFLKGDTLDHHIGENGMPISEVVRIGIEFLKGLSAAHAKGMIHRDIKPNNTFLEKRDDGPPRVKIIDFGLAKPVEKGLVQPADGVTSFGAAVGTPGYMPPEQFRGEEVDVRADLFAFGVMLYKLTTGRLPFGVDPMANSRGSYGSRRCRIRRFVRSRCASAIRRRRLSWMR